MGRKPVRIDYELTKELHKMLEAYAIEVPSNVELWVTNTKCGRFNPRQMNITVPVWAMELADRDKSIHCNERDYAVYYACHEIAHVLSQKSRVRGVMHSPEFYEAFKRVCPARLQYLETGYKPRLAAAAGISNRRTK